MEMTAKQKEEQAGLTLVVTLKDETVFSYLLDREGKTLQIHADRKDRPETPGDLFLARIDRIISGQNAAFIDYLPGKKGYLHLDTCVNALVMHGKEHTVPKPGDELVVRLQRFNTGGKQPTFSGRIELAGIYSVLHAEGNAAGVSRKMSGEDRIRWKTVADCHTDGDTSIVIRTNAVTADEETVVNEIMSLKEQLKRIRQKAQFGNCPEQLFSMPAGYLSRIASLQADQILKIVTDDPVLFDEINGFVKENCPGFSFNVSYYRDTMLSMEKLYSLERRLKEALDRKVWLKSGGFLIIEQTEALVSIDVNAGKGSVPGKKVTQEEQALKVNLEAAAEIARQIVIRNLSGIIVVDFLKMDQEEDRDRVSGALENGLRQDRLPCSKVFFTPLGLAEFTRKREEVSLQMTLKKTVDKYMHIE